MIGSVQSWWVDREPRERLLLAVLGALLTLFGLIFLLVLPLQAARADAVSALDRAKADMIAVSRLQAQTGQTGRAAFNRAVLVNVARAEDVKLTRVQPGADTTLSVWIDEAQTERLYAFFEALLTDYSASLDRVVISSDANGRLSAQFTIRGG
jgi:general secretion pathway protein M